jgi:hypothetical protein
MSSNGIHLHFACPHEQARRIISGHEEFWVSNCGCRESRCSCERFRMDVYLQFAPEVTICFISW